ncbi:MAG: glycerophosphodiester phosphodiesterase [Candidatus Hinthialibacter sp.]
MASVVVFIGMIFVVAPSWPQEAAKSSLIDFRDSQALKNRPPILIAHRGGVITPETPECSLAAIRLARQQGFDMVELDIQPSRDQVPVVFHDPNLQKACGMEMRIQGLKADEIKSIQYSNSRESIVTLDQALHECASLQLGVMLDIKTLVDEEYYHQIAALIRKHKLEHAAMTITGDSTAKASLSEVMLTGVNSQDFKKVQQEIPIDLQGRFWFGLPQNLPSGMVKKLQDADALVIPAINTFRYPAGNHFELARRDVERLNQAGVNGYQIDSVYLPLFLPLDN